MSSKTKEPLKSGRNIALAPGFFRRLGAQLYDAFLLAGLLLLAQAFLYLFATDESIRYYQSLDRSYLIAVSFLFYGWFWTHGGQTLGLRAWKIKVLTLDQKPISWKQSLLRFVTAIISWAGLGLGFMWILIDKNRYSWHDHVSKTALFYDNPKIKPDKTPLP